MRRRKAPRGTAQMNRYQRTLDRDHLWQEIVKLHMELVTGLSRTREEALERSARMLAARTELENRVAKLEFSINQNKHVEETLLRFGGHNAIHEVFQRLAALERR